MRMTAETLAAALFRASPDRVDLLDAEGRLLETNPSGCALMEIDDVAASRDRPWPSLWPAAERARVEAALDAARQGRAAVFAADGPGRRGTPRRWEVSLVPIHDGGGAIARIVAISRDVTAATQHERRLEQRLDDQRAALAAVLDRLDAERRRVEEARARIAHTEKLRVLGRFVGTVVHDINNVLASMAGAVRLLRRRGDAAQAADILDHVDRAVERGAGLVRRLLDISRSGDGDIEAVDLAAALAADADLLRHLAGRAVEVTIAVEPGTRPVLVAPGRLQSVLFNLVANARDAIAAGPGRLRLVARNRADDVPPGPAAGERVEIAVIDDGPGMPPEVLARIGEAFFTTKAAGEGTGLGLASAFDLAEEAGGRVEIDSAVGAGTRVSLILPCAGVLGPTFDGTEAEVEAGSGGAATILLVVAEAPLRARLAQVLRRLGHGVIEAGDGATAAAVVGAGTTVDLLVSDLDPGTGRGVDVARAARRERPDLPVVFLATGGDPSEAPAEPVLPRPIDERRLVREIRDRLTPKPTRREAPGG